MTPGCSGRIGLSRRTSRLRPFRRLPRERPNDIAVPFSMVIARQSGGWPHRFTFGTHVFLFLGGVHAGCSHFAERRSQGGCVNREGGRVVSFAPFDCLKREVAETMRPSKRRPLSTQ